MKVLYITPGCFDKGGISRYSRYQIKALRDVLGEHSVRVISLLGPDDKSFESEINVDWHANDNNYLSKILFSIQIAYQILFWRPDVVHVAHVNFSGLAWILAKIAKAKTVLNIYGLEVWSGLSVDAKFGLKNVQYVISDCYFTASYVEGVNYRAKGSTSVIWDCVDHNQFFPGNPDFRVLEKYGIPDPNKNFNVMTLGRLSFAASHKGYERLIDAFAKVASQHSKLYLVIAGDGDMKDTLQERVNGLGLQSRVIFTGLVEDKHMADVYRSATLFSLVSDRGLNRGEGIPLTPLEAMACGIPILVGNQDGSQEAVHQNSNGFVLDPLDINNISKAISKFIKDKNLLKKQQQGAIHISKQNFSYDDFCEKHKILYYSIMDIK